jgi:hypothetical protein
MGGTADTTEMRDVRSRRVFYRFKIVWEDQPLEMKLESAPDFSHSEMRAPPGPFFDVRVGGIFPLAFLISSSVTGFCGLNSDCRNGVCFATSRQAREIIAPEALHFHAAFLNFRPNASSEGERCMKDTVHYVVHCSVHLQISGRVHGRRSCAWHNNQFGRGQNTGLG